MPLLKLEDVQRGREEVMASPHCVRTPLLKDVQEMFDIDQNIKLYLKLENMQTTGSFKMRGLVTQFNKLRPEWGTEEHPLISMSAGSYGKAYAKMCNQRQLNAMLLMPDAAPDNRARIIESFGIQVMRKPSSELESTVDQFVRDKGCIYMHSFDDLNLMAGYGSIGLDILEDLPDPDIVLVCCGGGGLISGVAASIKLSGKHACSIYGVEPEGACTMHDSFKVGHAVGMNVNTVASGLAPPSAGKNAFQNCKAFVEDILLVSDSEIIEAMFTLHHRGMMVEPSGAAAFAALLHGKVPNSQGKKVVVVITGGNVTPEEMYQLQILHKTTAL